MKVLNLTLEIIKDNTTISGLVISEAILKMGDVKDIENIRDSAEIELIKNLINQADFDDKELAQITIEVIEEKEIVLPLLTNVIEYSIKDKETFKKYLEDKSDIYLNRETRNWINNLVKELKCDRCGEDLFNQDGAGILVPGTKAYCFDEAYEQFMPVADSFEEENNFDSYRCGNCGAELDWYTISDYM